MNRSQEVRNQKSSCDEPDTLLERISRNVFATASITCGQGPQQNLG